MSHGVRNQLCTLTFRSASTTLAIKSKSLGGTISVIAFLPKGSLQRPHKCAAALVVLQQCSDIYRSVLAANGDLPIITENTYYLRLI